MNCDDARRSLADYIDDQLSEDLRRDLEEHLATCGECSAILAELRELPRSLRDIPPLLVPESIHRLIADKANGALKTTAGGQKFAPRGLKRFTRLTALGLTAIVIAVTLAAFAFALMFDSRFEMLDIFNIRDLDAGQGQIADEGAISPTFEDLVLRAESGGPRAYDYLPRPEISVSGKHYAEDALEQVAIQPIIVAFSQEYRDVEAALYQDNVVSEIMAQATVLGLEKRVLGRCMETVLATTNDHALPSYVEKAFLNEKEVLFIVVNRTDAKSGKLLTGIAVFAFDPATASIVATWPRTPLDQAIDLRNINPHKSLACV
ncbi:MAG: zf-HC2 domain-containing protein, partial [Candidatus Aquicultor sp.]|nr:zf-HC2 domain-containing protein [Candidatus Aquicultor sp.]